MLEGAREHLLKDVLSIVRGQSIGLAGDRVYVAREPLHEQCPGSLITVAAGSHQVRVRQRRCDRRIAYARAHRLIVAQGFFELQLRWQAGSRSEAPWADGDQDLWVETISTLQGASWDTLFGTLPRTRLGPDIPWFPTTIMVALSSLARSSRASAGGLRTMCASTLTPAARILASASSMVARATSFVSGPQNFAAPSGAPTILVPRAGWNAVTTWTSASSALARRTASATACWAVSDPSVPTTIKSPTDAHSIQVEVGYAHEYGGPGATRQLHPPAGP